MMPLEIMKINKIIRYRDYVKILRNLSGQIVVLYLQYWLFIDMTNGFLMKNNFFFPGGFSLGELSRIVFIFFLLLAFRFKKNSLNLSLLTLPLLLLFISIFQILLFDSNVVSTINISIKLCLPILIFLYIKECLSNDRETLIKIIKINSSLLVLNLFISLFGFGFFTYNVSEGIAFGGKGFFYAGNEVSIVILVTYSLLAYLYKNKTKTVLLITLVYLLISFVSLTRASIAGVFLVYTAVIFLYQKQHRYKIMTLSFLLIAGMFYMLQDYILLAVNRAKYFIENTSMLIFMSGGHKRWEATRNLLDTLIESPLLILTGSGWTGYSEQDIMDLIAAFGIIGVTIYLIWFYIAAYTIKNHNTLSDKLFIFFVFTIVIGIATLAGHVMTSAMLAPFIGILGNIHLLKKKQPSRSVKFA